MLWALVLVTLPVTSFRFMPFMGSGTYVRPLALYPLAVLLPVLVIRLKRKEITRPWPGTLTIILAFLLVAVSVTAFGATLAPIELRGVDYPDRALRAAVTVVIGLAFFIAAVWMNQNETDLRFSVKWLLLGLVAHLLWGAAQFIGLNSGYRQQLRQIQNLFSVRGLVKNKRISGFAYEPSWLAGQIATLYLPWLVAAILTRYRALGAILAPAGVKTNTPRTGLGISTSQVLSLIEPALLIGALIGLLMTYSRSGLLIAVVAGTVTLVLAGKETLSKTWYWFLSGFRRQGISYPGENGSFYQATIIRFLLVILVLSVLASAAFFLADKGYIAALFKADKTNFVSYIQGVYLGPRLAYASAAFQAFEIHPLTGVGLGASGFYIFQNMPDWILSGEPEVSRQMSPNITLFPNPKNLYVRLLAETGLPGFMLFVAFYLALFGDALNLLRTNPSSQSDHTANPARWLATAGIFALSAVVLQGFSQDSFGMPEMWVNLGILAGAAGAFCTQQTVVSATSSKNKAKDRL